MAFPDNNLPSASQPWTRDVEGRVETLERTVKTNEINGVSRDVQLESNYKRLDKVVNDLIEADIRILAAQAEASAASAEAVAASAEASSAAAQASTAATAASNAVNGLMGLDTPGSPYPVVGDNITAGTITGSTVQTASSGTRVVLNGPANQIQFYYGGSSAGSITGGLVGGSTPVVSVSGSMSLSGDVYATDGSFSTLDCTGVISAGDTVFTESYTVGASQVGSLQVNGVTDLLGTTNAQAVNATTVTTTSNLVVGSAGYVQALDTYNRNVGAGRIMYVSSLGTYNCATSSARYKEDILPYQVNPENFFKLEPVSFKYKKAVEELGEDAPTSHGFIAEQAAESGMTEFVDFEPDENGNLRPDNFKYIDFTAALYSIVKMQEETIQSLTKRIEALEAK